VVGSRHHYLLSGEDIRSGVGLRTTTQKYGAVDAIRRKYSMTDRGDSTEHDHNWAGKYESKSGRFMSPDPFGGSMSIADPQSFNRHSYTQNDPVNFIDPGGLFYRDVNPPPLPHEPDCSGLFDLMFTQDQPQL
jgi:RHS repeat-associated protein